MLFLKKELNSIFGEIIIPGIIYIFISLFFFIIFSNFIGLIPYIFTRTNNLSITLIFILPIWLGTILFSIIFQYYNLLVNLTYMLFQFLLIFFSFFILGYIFYKFYFLDFDLLINKFCVSAASPEAVIILDDETQCSKSRCLCILQGHSHFNFNSVSNLCVYWDSILKEYVIPYLANRIPLPGNARHTFSLYDNINNVDWFINPHHNRINFTFYMNNRKASTIDLELTSRQFYPILDI